MLLDNFFTIDKITHTDTDISADIKLNVDHPIYAGHFPQQPVVPGVCMMQILAELSTQALAQKVVLKKATQAKFLIPIIPQKHPNLAIKIAYKIQDDQSLKLSASIHSEDLTFFKFKGLFSQL